MNKVISIIPARGGSKGLPKKNIKELAGKPLIAYSIAVSLQSQNIDRTIVSTDDLEIKKVAEDLGAEVIMRPDDLATDKSPMEPVLIHVVNHLSNTEKYDCDAVVLLQPTCPLRSVNDVDQAVKIFFEKKADSVVSVFEDYYYSWFGEIAGTGEFVPQYEYQHRTRRQEITPKYHEIGSIYVMSKELLLTEQCRMGGKIFPYILDKRKAIDIDDEFSFWLIEQMITKKKIEL